MAVYNLIMETMQSFVTLLFQTSPIPEEMVEELNYLNTTLDMDGCSIFNNTAKNGGWYLYRS